LDQSRKQRVVGAVVLLIAAVVILPILFDGQGSYQLPLESRVPPAPPFPEVPRIEAVRPEIAADSDHLSFQPDAEPADAVVLASPASPADGSNSAPQPTPTLAVVESDPVIDSVTTAVVPVVPPPVLDSDGLPEGWSVRLASFASAANAGALVERLMARGHRTYVRQITSSQGPLTAVFVGPGADRAAMLQLQRQLQDEFQLAGIVVRYEIEGL
jgi:DedD protein